MFHEGQQLGNYTLIRRIGRGGFGEVWLGEKRSQFLSRRVAIKLPLGEQVDLEAIRHEAMLWEQASGHPNVLPIVDADVYDGQVAIVSEYAEGGSLADKLKSEGRFPIKEAVEATVGILNGLQYLHNKKIIHRDIKPQNILLQEDTPRLADFGISRAMKTTAFSSAIIGTDAYMSPESFKGERSPQTDIWSVGVVLYQLLMGRLPFVQEHPSERMYAIINNDFLPLPDNVPQDLKTIVAKALVKNSQERYQSAEQMREDLRRFLHGELIGDSAQSSFPEDGDSSKIIQLETATIIRPNTAKDEDLTGVLWKLGCNWGGRQNPSFYTFIKDEGIAIGIEKLRYSEGDLLLIADGFTIKAIARINEDPKPLSRNSGYDTLFDYHKVKIEEQPIYAKAEWYELKPNEVFQYKMQRGGCKVNQPEIKERVFALWGNRETKGAAAEPNETQYPQNNHSISTSSYRPLTLGQKQKLDLWKYEKTARRQDEHPILETPPVFERRRNEWTSSDYAREITFQITGRQTFHAQENMELLREHLNTFINDENKILRRSAMQNGKGVFENYEGLFFFDFQSNANPTKDKFLKEINIFLYGRAELLPTQKSSIAQTLQPTIKSFPAKPLAHKSKDKTIIDPKPSFLKENAETLLSIERNKKGKSINKWMVATIVLFGISAIIFFVSIKRSAKPDSTQFIPQTPVTDKLAANNSSNLENTNSLLTPNVNTPTAVQSPSFNKTQAQKKMIQNIASRIRNGGGGETLGKTKFFYGDLDGDGDEDALLEYDWDYFEAGGNGYGTSLAVFRNNNGNFDFVTVEEIRGKIERNFYTTSIKNGKIYGRIETCSDPLAHMGLCPKEDTQKGNTQYSLQGSKLIER